MRSSSADTVAELVRRQWGDHRTGLRDEHHTLTHHQVAAGAAARAALLVELMPPLPGREPHLLPEILTRDALQGALADLKT